MSDENKVGLDNGDKTSFMEDIASKEMTYEEIINKDYLQYFAELDFPGRFLNAVRNALEDMHNKSDKEVKEAFYIRISKVGYLKVSDKTIDNWLSGRSFPKSEDSRDEVFRICYCLGLDIEETKKFFARCCLFPFNYKRRNDVAYLFFIRRDKGRTMDTFNAMLNFIENLPKPADEQTEGNKEYDTMSLKGEFEKLTKKDMLPEYILKYCNTRRKYTTAVNAIHKLQVRCTLDFYTFDELRYMLPEALRKDLKFKITEKKSMELQCLIDCDKLKGESQEALEHAMLSAVMPMSESEEIKPDDEERRLKLQSLECKILDKIYDVRIRRDTKRPAQMKDSKSWIPEEEKWRFTLEEQKRIDKAFSYIRQVCPKGSLKNLQNETPEVIRNTIILLSFANQVNRWNWENDIEPYFKQFEHMVNSELNNCGFSSLYPRNPFDFIILKSFGYEEPLSFFNEVIEMTVNDEDETSTAKEDGNNQ